MLDCHWKTTFGVECLGCGFQRSIELLLHGNFIASIQQFPATLPLLATIIYTILHLQFKFNKGAKVIIALFSLTAILIVVNFIMKL